MGFSCFRIKERFVTIFTWHSYAFHIIRDTLTDLIIIIYHDKKQSFHNERIVLKDNGGVIREQKKVAEVLAEYFSSSQHPDFNQLPPKSYQQIKAHQSRPFTLTNTSPGEVKRIMKNLKTNKATGHDQIPARAIKESAEILCQPFSCLVNFLFERGKVPSSWKLGEIVPVQRKTVR